jgi:WD40 repeat protein/predicted Ser/Thr protein kinase
VTEGLRAGDPVSVGPFRLLGRLGEGGMGRVFLGTSRGGRKVAIKVVHPHYASDPEFRRRFAREVAAARQVGGFHTALVVDADPDAEPPWMATAYIPGPSLADAIAQRGPLGPTAVRELGAALAEGLATIHACGIIHRDLKPGNIILADDGPRIIDFGIAKGADSTSLTGSHGVIGTLRYMSPEQLHGLELTPQSDVFALGTILAYAATGHDPFGAPTMPAVINRILNEPPDLVRLPDSLRDVISACLAKNPADRPSTGDLLALFDPPEGGSEPVATAEPEPYPARAMFPGHLQAHAAEPERTASQESSAVSTIGLRPGLASQQAGAVSWPPTAVSQQADPVLWPPTAGPLTVPGKHVAPTRGILRRAYRRPVVLTAVVIAVAAGLTAFGVSLTGHPAAKYSWATAVLTDPTSKAVDSVAFGPGNALATADRNGKTYIWNTNTKQITTTLTDPTSKGVASVAFGPGNTLATGDLNGNAYVWNTTTGQITATTNAGGKGVDSVAFGSGGTLAAGDLNGNTYLSLPNEVLVIANASSGGTADSVTYGRGGNLLAMGQLNGTVEFYNIATSKFVGAGLTDPVSARHPNRGIVSMAFGPGGTSLATADQSGNAHVWNVATGKITATLPAAANAGGTATVAFGPGGTTLASSDGTNTTYLWPIASHKS